MTISNYAVNPQGFGLPEIREKAHKSYDYRLSLMLSIESIVGLGNNPGAVAKSTARIGTLQLTYRRIFASSLMLVFLYAAFAHLNYGGLSRGASARRFLWGGSSNLAQFTTSQRLEPLGGEFFRYSQEVAIMATQLRTPKQNYPFLIASGLWLLIHFDTFQKAISRTPVEEGALC